jgi:hypothetical protein
VIVTKPASSGSAIEFPVDLDFVTVHSTVPCPCFPTERSQIGDPASAEALPREKADFDFRLVEPLQRGARPLDNGGAAENHRARVREDQYLLR